MATRYRIPSSIASDLSVDVTDDLADFIAWVPDESTILWPHGAQYRVDRTITITDRYGLRWIGLGGDRSTTEYGAVGNSTIQAVTNGDELGGGSETKNRYLIELIGGAGFQLYNINLIGANPFAGVQDAAYNINRESQHCLSIRGHTDFLIDRLTCRNPFGDYVYIAPRPVTFDLPARGTIRRFLFDSNGRQGLSILGGLDLYFYQGILTNNRRAAIDIEPNDPVDHKRIKFCHLFIGPTRLNMFSNVGDLNADMEDVMFEFCTFYGSAGPDFAVTTINSTLGSPSLAVGKRRRFSYRHCVTANERGTPNEAAVAAYSYDGLHFYAVTQPMENGRNMRLVRIGNCSDVRALNCILPKATGSIRLDGIGGNTDYCSSGCQIGNPLVPDTPLVSCP